MLLSTTTRPNIRTFFNCLHDAAKEKTTAELGTLTRRLLTAAADGALLCIGHIKGGFTDEV